MNKFLRDLDIKVTGLVFVGTAAFLLYTLFRISELDRVPDEIVVYFSSEVGDVEPADLDALEQERAEQSLNDAPDTASD
jgi:hypothetical protein